MAVAALITWLVTAIGGFVMLGIWLTRGGHQKPSSTQLPPAVLFSHFVLAAIGLVLWIIYVATDNHVLAWISFVLLLPVAVLGFTMLLRWRAGRASATSGERPVDTDTAPEQRFPVGVVVGHGVFAVATVVLVLLAALGL